MVGTNTGRQVGSPVPRVKEPIIYPCPQSWLLEAGGGREGKRHLLFLNLYCSDEAFLFPLTFTSPTLEDQTASESEGGLDQ